MLSLLAFAALGAVASASAPAASWVVENATLGNGVKAEFSECLSPITKSKIKAEGAVLEAEEISFINKAGEEVSETCVDTHKNTESFIEGPNKGVIAGLEFSGVKVITPAGCKLKTADDIRTQGILEVGEAKKQTELELTLEESGTKRLVKFTPKQRLNGKGVLGTPPFAEIEFKVEAACGTLSGKTIEIKGFTTAEIESPTTCSQGHTLKINESPSNLKTQNAAVEEFVQEIGTEGLESNKCWGTT